MQVFVRYMPGCAEAFRVTGRSWRSLGWTVRLILPGDKEPSPKALVVDPWLMNYGIRPAAWTKSKRLKRKFQAAGWDKAPLVQYPPTFSDNSILLARAYRPSN